MGNQHTYVTPNFRNKLLRHICDTWYQIRILLYSVLYDESRYMKTIVNIFDRNYFVGTRVIRESTVYVYIKSEFSFL